MRAWLGAATAFNDDKHDLPAGEREVVSNDGMVTSVLFPDEVDLGEALISMTHPTGVWARQSPDKPKWVASDNEALAMVLGAHFGVEVRPAPADSVPLAKTEMAE
jgi:hypothetical protein